MPFVWPGWLVQTVTGPQVQDDLVPKLDPLCPLSMQPIINFMFSTTLVFLKGYRLTSTAYISV